MKVCCSGRLHGAFGKFGTKHEGYLFELCDVVGEHFEGDSTLYELEEVFWEATGEKSHHPSVTWSERKHGRCVDRIRTRFSTPGEAQTAS